MANKLKEPSACISSPFVKYNSNISLITRLDEYIIVFLITQLKIKCSDYEYLNVILEAPLLVAVWSGKDWLEDSISTWYWTEQEQHPFAISVSKASPRVLRQKLSGG